MTATVRNRLLLLGSAWGVLLAALPALVMARPYRLSRGFLDSFFVALSVFLYAVAGGTLLGPAFGRLVHRAVRGGAVILLRLLGVGAVYGLGFMFVKSLFPEPFALLVLQGGDSSEGNLTVLALVYMGVGLISGLIAAPSSAASCS